MKRYSDKYRVESALYYIDTALDDLYARVEWLTDEQREHVREYKARIDEILALDPMPQFI